MQNNSAKNPTILFGLYGAGGCGRGVMPLVRDNLERSHKGARIDIVFVETNPTNTEVNGYKIISDKEFFDRDCQHRLFNIAIANSKIREKIAEESIVRGARPISLHSPHSIMYDNNEIGEGAILCANTMITSNIKIGKFFHSNIYSYVEHDCIIGDYVTFAPNVHCNGNIHIHNHAYIGTGAIIKQGTPSKPLVIGEGAIIGMGAVVTKDVAPYTTVVGNPARPLVKA